MKNLQGSPEVALDKNKVRRKFGLWQAIGFTLLGSLFTFALFLLAFVFFAGVEVTKTSLPLPALSGASDLTAEVSQEYINREIATALVKNPISVVGVVEVKGLVVQFSRDNPIIDVGVRITALGRQFDFKIKDTVVVKNNKVELNLAEDLRLEGLFLPLGVLNGVVEQINSQVAQQLNQQLASISNARDAAGKTLGRVPTLLSLSFGSGILIARFAIKIQ